MWSIASNAFPSIGMKKNLAAPSEACSEFSDDEVCSNASREEGLECPVCWESFNIVENVPYVLWCGHTLCKHCILGLQWVVFRVHAQRIKIPFLISCPWCQLLSFRLVYKGQLKFPSRNFFLLWMIESLNGDRLKDVSSLYEDNQSTESSKSHSSPVNQARNTNLRRAPSSCVPGRHGPDIDDGSSGMERLHFSLHKSLDCFIHLTSKFPLVIVLLLIIFFAIPGSAFVLAVYLVITVIFAIPSSLVLYFAFPTLKRLVREIVT